MFLTADTSIRDAIYPGFINVEYDQGKVQQWIPISWCKPHEKFVIGRMILVKILLLIAKLINTDKE